MMDVLHSNCQESTSISSSSHSDSLFTKINSKTPIIEHVEDEQKSCLPDDDGDDLDFLINSVSIEQPDKTVENKLLKRKIEVLEEKCFALTCKQLDLKLQESGEVEKLLGKNSQLTQENYQLKRQYFELSTQFNQVVQLCNSMVKALEERESVQTQLKDMTIIAEELDEDVQILQDEFKTINISRSRLNSTTSDTETIYYDAFENLPDD